MKYYCETCKAETEHFWKHGGGMEAQRTCKDCVEWEDNNYQPNIFPTFHLKGNGWTKSTIGAQGSTKALVDKQTGQRLKARKGFSFKNYD